MAFLTGNTRKNQIEETEYRSSISEGTAKKLGEAVNYILDGGFNLLGVIQASCLTESQFQAIRGDSWVLMRGQSIAGSDFATLTGIMSLPDFIGVGAHLEQLESGNSVFDFFPNQNLDHDHDNGGFNRLLRTVTVYEPAIEQFININTIDSIDASPNEPELTTSAEILAEGGDRFRPNSYQINYFIKINE
jgi:hypothetical protein